MRLLTSSELSDVVGGAINGGTLVAELVITGKLTIDPYGYGGGGGGGGGGGSEEYWEAFNQAFAAACDLAIQIMEAEEAAEFANSSVHLENGVDPNNPQITHLKTEVAELYASLKAMVALDPNMEIDDGHGHNITVAQAFQRLVSTDIYINLSNPDYGAARAHSFEDPNSPNNYKIVMGVEGLNHFSTVAGPGDTGLDTMLLHEFGHILSWDQVLGLRDEYIQWDPTFTDSEFRQFDAFDTRPTNAYLIESWGDGYGAALAAAAVMGFNAVLTPEPPMYNPN